MHRKRFYSHLSALIFCLLPFQLSADVVKPALIEISMITTGEISIEIRASIEALLTGINGQYKNTQDAPSAEEYDVYRKMQADQLQSAFEGFKTEFLSGIDLKLDESSVPLNIVEVKIPEPGYTKVPRISLIVLKGEADRNHHQLTWYYPARFGDHATRVKQVDPQQEAWHWSDHQWIRDDVYTEPYALDQLFTRQSLYSVVKTYVVAGFEHILPLGTDHILFVLGIFLLSTQIKPLLWQVTMFTLAHSITLSLSMLNIFSLPPRVVEPLIALSIAYVAVENVFRPQLHNSRLYIVFAFGLLHGLGFASVLSDFGMPKDDFALALVFFNVGIEFGQIAVIAIAWLALAVWFKSQQLYRQVVVVPLSLMISAVGLYWFWERLEWIS